MSVNAEVGFFLLSRLIAEYIAAGQLYQLN